MKKTGILQRDLARAVATMGHGDLLVIGDAGLPVPPGVPCIDLAVCVGTPPLWPVLDAVLSELRVERAAIASEAAPDLACAFAARLPVGTMAHADLKAESARAVAIVRTGEATPYANILLWSGVVF